MRFDFVKNRYDYELQRKEQLTAALTLPVGVLSGLGGLIALMARSLYLPLLKELQEWENAYREFLDQVPTADTTLEQSLDEHLLERIITAADRNTQNNDERSRLLYWARIALFWVLFSTALAGIPYVADQVRY